MKEKMCRAYVREKLYERIQKVAEKNKRTATGQMEIILEEYLSSLTSQKIDK